MKIYKNERIFVKKESNIHLFIDKIIHFQNLIEILTS